MKKEIIPSIIKTWAPFLTALAAFLTLLLLKIEYKSSVEPNIKFNNTEIYIHAERTPYGNGFGYLATYIHNGDPDTNIFIREPNSSFSIKSIYPQNLNRFNLQIVNIGRGPASNLQFNWEIDTTFWNNVLKRFKGVFQFQSFTLSNQSLFINESNDTMPYLDNHYTEYIHFLLPSSESPNESFIQLPLNYFRLICHLKFYCLSSHEFISEYPPLRLEIQYLDSRNKRKRSTYEFNLELSKDYIGVMDGKHLYHPGVISVKQTKMLGWDQLVKWFQGFDSF